MKTQVQKNRHSPGERARIVAVGAGFAAVFLMLSQVFEDNLTDLGRDLPPSIPRRLMAWTVDFGIRFVLLPAGLVTAIVAAWQGAVGKPTGLTLWVLRETDGTSPPVVKTKRSPWGKFPWGELPLFTVPGWAGRAVPGWLSWSIVLGIVAAFAFYAAFRRLSDG